MSNKNLGRGLSAFLDMNNLQPTVANVTNDGKSVLNINVEDIVRNPYQPRQIFDEENLDSLAESIKRKGVLQPILVVRLDNGKYQLVAGERRLRGTKIAGLAEIPAIVTDMKAEDQLEVAILENIQREDLNPLDEAEAYRRLIEEFQHTQEELSGILGKSRSHITNILRLLSLPEDVKSLVRNGKLTFGHARTLVGSAEASQLARQIIEQALSVRETENIMKNVKIRRSDPLNAPAKKKHSASPEIATAAGQISALVGLEVRIKLKNQGGIVEIDFKNFEELDALFQKLNRLGEK
ncbi:MAG: ParB/RepB/Spo0J family partition protein [Holosporaceae bacterium]|jgi:ParB family chromosome partitioning protein|nr:ParB/RepB/Spo0J family partition protein [Holosporaceae bacterium]